MANFIGETGMKASGGDDGRENMDSLLHDTLARVIGWFEDWETNTQAAREDSERDHDYYHGRQWDQEEIDELEDRGQPVIVKNHIFKKINFLLGNEIRNRADPRALPRTPAHDEDVIAITDALRFVLDEEDFDQTSSRVWGNMLIEGYGGAVVEHEIKRSLKPIAAETTIEPTPGGVAVESIDVQAEEQEIQIKIRRVPWDRIWVDTHSREPDFSDARHLGIHTWWYLEDALAHYADNQHSVENFREILEGAAGDAGARNDTYDDRPIWSDSIGRIRVSECYFLESDELTGQMVWKSCHYTKSGFVVPPMKTGLKDEDGVDVCPFTAVASFTTRNGERYGLGRHMIGPQDEINKRSSKMLHLLSVDRTVYEDGALLDPDQTRQERAKPDGQVKVRKGALVKGQVTFEKGLDVAQGHALMLQDAKQDIASIGPEIPQIGSVAGGASGISIQQRMQIGSLELMPLVDNLRRWKIGIYKRVWFAIRQFWTTEKWIRVTDDAEKKGFRFVGLNRRMTRGQRIKELVDQGVAPESAMQTVGLPPTMPMEVAQRIARIAQQNGQQPPPPEQMGQIVMQAIVNSPQGQEMMTAADVAQIGVDITLEETPDVAIVQHEEVVQLREILQTAISSGATSPDFTRSLIKMIIQAGQLRGKKKILAEMDQPPDPAAVQRQQQQEQMQMQAMQMQMQQLQASIQALQAQAQLNQAKAMGEQVDAQAKAALTPTEAELNQAKTAQAMAHAGTVAGGAGSGSGVR
jgi:hypothetical protein